jgi:hypothetical protein
LKKKTQKQAFEQLNFFFVSEPVKTYSAAAFSQNGMVFFRKSAWEILNLNPTGRFKTPQAPGDLRLAFLNPSGVGYIFRLPKKTFPTANGSHTNEVHTWEYANQK